MRRLLTILGTLLLAAPLAASLAAQQVRVLTKTDRDIAVATSGDRAMIGVATSSGSKRDTLGVLITDITQGGPADKAGLTEGDRIQAINGVSLRVSRDDAGDDEMGAIMQRRLTRELGKAKAGDEVTLQVWHDGATKAIKVKTVAADDLYQPALARTKAAAEDRAVIGIGYGLSGSKRDTLGVFVNSVTEDGPAEKAGIVEGDRIAAINGVSLKLSKDDLDDGWVASARMNRLSREMAKVKPGDVVELTVVSGGRARAVKVTAAKASSLKSSGSRAFTIFRSPDAPEAPMPPMTFAIPAPKAPPAPRAPMVWQFRDDGGDVDVHFELDKARQEIERVMRIEMPRVREETRKALEEARVRVRTMRTVRM